MKDREALQEVFAQAVDKFERGRRKYGEFDPATDTRDLLAEAENEILDAINYLAMHLVKLRTLREGIQTHGKHP